MIPAGYRPAGGFEEGGETGTEKRRPDGLLKSVENVCYLTFQSLCETQHGLGLRTTEVLSAALVGAQRAERNARVLG